MARGGHCSVSCGSSFSRLRRIVVTKQAGAPIVQRRSRPISQVLIVPPPELPGDADVIRIDFLARQQIIERPDAVPGPPGAEKFADQVLLIARIANAR